MGDVLLTEQEAELAFIRSRMQTHAPEYRQAAQAVARAQLTRCIEALRAVPASHLVEALRAMSNNDRMCMGVEDDAEVVRAALIAALERTDDAEEAPTT